MKKMFTVTWISIFILGTLNAVVVNAYTGADAPSWASAAVNQACARLIVNCAFPPNFSETINRAVAYQMLTSGFAMRRSTASSPFSDVDGQWYEDAAHSAFTLGWTAGTSPGVFNGGAPVTRAQMAVALTAVLGLAPGTDAMLIDYTDRSRIPLWAVSSMAAVVNARLMGQEPRRLRPNDALNKVEAIVIVNAAVTYAQNNQISVVDAAARRFNVSVSLIQEALATGKNIVNGQLVTPSPVAPPGQQVQTVSMTAANFSFSPNTLALRLNQPVTLNIQASQTPHTFTIDELGVNQTLNEGMNTVTFTPTRIGTFQYYCAISGHRILGMFGTAIVSP